MIIAFRLCDTVASAVFAQRSRVPMAFLNVGGGRTTAGACVFRRECCLTMCYVASVQRNYRDQFLGRREIEPQSQPMEIVSMQCVPEAVSLIL